MPNKSVKPLTKLPVPAPSDVLLFAVVGPVLVLQQMPLAVTVAPPSLVIFPPLVADPFVIDVIAAVVIEGRPIVVNATSTP